MKLKTKRVLLWLVLMSSLSYTQADQIEVFSFDGGREELNVSYDKNCKNAFVAFNRVYSNLVEQEKSDVRNLNKLTEMEKYDPLEKKDYHIPKPFGYVICRYLPEKNGQEKVAKRIYFDSEGVPLTAMFIRSKDKKDVDLFRRFTAFVNRGLKKN